MYHDNNEKMEKTYDVGNRTTKARMIEEEENLILRTPPNKRIWKN